MSTSKRKKKTTALPPWTVWISDGFCKYKFVYPDSAGNHSIADVNRAIAKKLKVAQPEGKYVSR